MIVVYFSLGLVVLLLVILSFIWPPDSPWSPKWRTNRDTARRALKLANVTKKDTVYELGCGDGEVVLIAAKDFGARATGIEIDPLRALISIVRVRLNRLSSQVNIVSNDFKQINLADATVIYMYLVPAGMQRLIPKFKKELANGVRIISYRYQLPLEKNEKNIRFVKEDKEKKIFLYRFIQNSGKN